MKREGAINEYWPEGWPWKVQLQLQLLSLDVLHLKKYLVQHFYRQHTHKTATQAIHRVILFHIEPDIVEN